jgi:hypothetical protein
VLALAAVTSRMKVKLPGIEGNMSVNLPFLLMAVVSLSAVEAVSIACRIYGSTVLAERDAKFKPEQMLFNVSMMAFATSMANLIWNAAWLSRASWTSQPLLLASATAALLSGSNGSCGEHHHADPRPAHETSLDEHRTSVIPLLRD